MTGAWFFVAPAAVRDGRVTLGDDDSHHLLRVLRARFGDLFVVVAGETAYQCRLAGNEDGRAVGEIVAATPAGGEPPVHITLFQGLAKGDKFEWVLQKGTELGVCAFVPVACARSVVRLDASRATERVRRWQVIARAAAGQCRRSAPPVVAGVVDWAVAAGQAGQFDLALVPWEARAGAPGLRPLLARAAERAPGGGRLRIAVYIGPEGGLTEAEVSQATGAGAHTVGLGPRILRTETAGLALVAAIQYAVGDLG